MKFVCTSCGSVYRIENTGGIEPPKSDPRPPRKKPTIEELEKILASHEDRTIQVQPDGSILSVPCPPPHKVEPAWQRAFVEADNARCKLEGELEREREISDRFQKENNTLTMKCNALEETLEKQIDERRRAENEARLLKQNYARLEGDHGKLIAQLRNLRSWL